MGYNGSPLTGLNRGGTVPVSRDRLRTLFPFHLVLAAIVAFWIFLAEGRQMGDPDIWWHLLNARTLFTTGHLPSVDTFSFTAIGTPVVGSTNIVSLAL